MPGHVAILLSAEAPIVTNVRPLLGHRHVARIGHKLCLAHTNRMDKEEIGPARERGQPIRRFTRGFPHDSDVPNPLSCRGLALPTPSCQAAPPDFGAEGPPDGPPMPRRTLQTGTW